MNDTHFKSDQEIDILLSDCDCCENLNQKKLTPVKIENDPGLSTILYRVGTHSRFKASMFASLRFALPNITTRQNDDLAIGLIDAWAIVSDVLAFYQERIANEGFLRTATERRSILELARAVGYELKAGVAATTFLSFTIDDANGTLEKTVIGKGTKVQSIPDQGEMPQTFETIEELEARHEWNELGPKQTKLQNIKQGEANAGIFYFSGTNTKLKAGDTLLVVNVKDNKVVMPQTFNIVIDVKEEPEFQRTIVQIIQLDKIYPPVVSAVQGLPETAAEGQASGISPFQSNVEAGSKLLKNIRSTEWTESDLIAYAHEHNLSRKDLDIMINFAARKAAIGDSAAASTIATATATGGLVATKVYVLRRRAAVFGHNAPGSDKSPITEGKNTIYLDNTYSDVLPSTHLKDSWAVLQSKKHSGKWAAYRITDTFEETTGGTNSEINGRAVILKVTGIIVEPREGEEPPLSDFEKRTTSIFIKSEQLELAEMPEDESIGGKGNNGNIIILDRKVSFLHPGQIVAITGMLVDEEDETVPLGVTMTEIAAVREVGGNDYYTRLVFSKNLINKYKRDTVNINANVVRANHGETKIQVLGSGDPSYKYQQFSLKQSPLTHISAPTAGGTESTLELKVDDVLWEQVPSFYSLGINALAYVVRIQDSGETNIIFGDGIHGKRPTAGIENIRARYRVGIGRSGMLKASQLNLLMDRPLGARSVTNPLSTSGAEDSERLDDARINAPLHTLTLGRVVSLKDFEDFAKAFAGIAKAQANWIWDNENRSIHLTVAAVDGKQLDENMHRNLAAAISAAKDPLIKVIIGSFTSILFNIVASVVINKNMDSELIKEKVMKVLLGRFSFDSREFGQDVFLGEVMVVIQGVEGVVSVNIERLYKFKAGTISDTTPLQAVLTANFSPQHQEDQGELKSIELLTINPEGIWVKVIKQ